MIDSCLIIPTESPISMYELKRALMSYDTVYVNSPDDRELIPPNTYNAVQGIALGFHDFPHHLFGIPSGAVKPLGKIKGFDDSFAQILDESKSLIANGKLQLVPTPIYEQRLIIGKIIIPPDTPEPYSTYRNYRLLSQDEKFVNLIAQGLTPFDPKKHDDDLVALVPSCQEDEPWTLNGLALPPLATFNSSDLSDDTRRLISRIAHARVGSLSKALGYCSLKQLIPFTTDQGYGKVIENLQYDFSNAINSINSNQDVIKRQKQLNLIERLVFEEYIDPTIIDRMSINDIMRLRTKAWGDHYEAKFKFFETLSQVAASSTTDKAFTEEVDSLLKDYMKHVDGYRNEIEKLNLNVVMKTLFGTFALGPGNELVQRFLSTPDFNALVVLGLLGAKEAATHFSQFIDILDKIKDSRGLLGYSIYNHYSYIK